MISQNHQRSQSVTHQPHAPMRSRSEASTSSQSRQRPMSRESTTSEQSAEINNTISYRPEQPAESQSGVYMVRPDPTDQRVYQNGPEEMLLQYGQHMAQAQHYSIDPNLATTHQNEMQPTSQNAFQNPDMHPYAMMQGYPHGMPQYGLPQGPVPNVHAQARNHDALENQSPAPEDSENPENGSKRKKGAATSLANDAELRRLLKQYQGKTLKEVASEVQRKEGGEGKSEKAKQVFAMLWLQENCRRSSNSVRRDRVFTRYTERCGNERVPTLNPASFGKLVRIIFPNVQTRRLGVRGESKYHYVDLSLFPEDDERQYPSQANISTIPNSGNTAPTSTLAGSQFAHGRTMSISQPAANQGPTDTADFPSPSKSFPPRTVEQAQPSELDRQTSTISKPQPLKMDCLYLNTPLIRMNTSTMSANLVSALPSVRSNLPATLSTYLGLPASASHTKPSSSDPQSDLPIELPDIHTYLQGTHYDKDIASSLSYLYRSYCIVVIDSFRFCREKPFFHHHSAFNGTMTVPVAKLLANERLAPWIQECDMRMYKKMIRYIAPLVSQVVPEQVWNVFERVSNKLVPHLVGAFEEKCPTHVVVAKVVPAMRFCHLLKKLRSANTAANHVAGMLADDRGRTQMWVDLMTCVDPQRVMEESMPPPECWNALESIFRGDLKNLISPVEEDLVRSIEQDSTNLFSSFLSVGDDIQTAGNDFREEFDSPGPLDRWIQWLEKLPSAMPNHHPQCLVNWHNGFWKSILTQLGIGGAQSYQAWWYLEAFLTNMLGWLTQMEGLLMDESQQKDMEERENTKRRQDDQITRDKSPFQSHSVDQSGTLKRKRNEEDVGGEERSASGASHMHHRPSEEASNGDSKEGVSMAEHSGLDGVTDDQDFDEISNAGPLDLPSIDTRTPAKRSHHHAHDDSGISLDADIEADGTGTEDQLKSLKKEWGILSDPADADGHVVVV